MGELILWLQFAELGLRGKVPGKGRLSLSATAFSPSWLTASEVPLVCASGYLTVHT